MFDKILGFIQKAVNTLGQVRVSIETGEAHVGSMGGYTVPVRVTLTRPTNTTAYTALDCIADATSSASTLDFDGAGRVEGGTGYITGLRFETDQATNTAAYVLYLFTADPAAVIVDNAVWNSLKADKAKRIGSINIPAVAKIGASGDSVISDVSDLKLPYNCASGAQSIKGQLKAVDAFTPANAQIFDITLIFDQN